MGLQDELGFIGPIKNHAHNALLNLVLTGQMLMKEGQRVLRPFGLTDSQFNVLMLLKHQSKNGELNQTSLGNMLLVNRANVTGLIDRMEEAGWVKRTAQAGDRRVNLVRITNTGRRLLERAEKVYYPRVEEIISALTDEETIHFCTMMEKVRGKIRTP